MPLTDTQIKNAKPDRRPPVRLKGGHRKSNSDEAAEEKASSTTAKATAKSENTKSNSAPAKQYKTKSGAPPKSYKLYDGENLYIEIFRNGSKFWRFRYKFPKENVISLGLLAAASAFRVSTLPG